MRDGEIDIQQPLGDESDDITFYTTIILRPTSCIVMSTETVFGSSHLNAIPGIEEVLRKDVYHSVFILIWLNLL